MAEVEAEDRTQAPSKLRLQQARERGMAAHSPELTAAAALLAATLMLGVVGEPLASGLLTIVRGPFVDHLDVALDAASAVEHLRGAAWSVVGPMGLLLLGLVAAGFMAHQAQVGLLWVPSLMAPDVARLWGVGAGRGLAARMGRGLWSIAKSAVVVVVAAWAIRSRFDELAGLGGLDTLSLARAWARALQGLLGTLAVSALALGLVDYAMQRRRFAAALRLTPEQSREDQKAMDGDPALRGRRLRLARAWRGDAPELLAGASLAVVGSNGLIVVLAGTPPGKVTVRSAADGATGAKLRRSAEKARVATVERPDLARKLAQLAARPNARLTPESIADLAAVWPALSSS
jgi:flagellar biosynthetic protein FlhB